MLVGFVRVFWRFCFRACFMQNCSFCPLMTFRLMRDILGCRESIIWFVFILFFWVFFSDVQYQLVLYIFEDSKIVFEKELVAGYCKLSNWIKVFFLAFVNCIYVPEGGITIVIVLVKEFPYQKQITLLFIYEIEERIKSLLPWTLKNADRSYHGLWRRFV